MTFHNFPLGISRSLEHMRNVVLYIIFFISFFALAAGLKWVPSITYGLRLDLQVVSAFTAGVLISHCPSP